MKNSPGRSYYFEETNAVGTETTFCGAKLCSSICSSIVQNSPQVPLG